MVLFKEKQRATNIGLALWRLAWFYETFVLKSAKSPSKKTVTTNSEKQNYQQPILILAYTFILLIKTLRQWKKHKIVLASISILLATSLSALDLNLTDGQLVKVIVRTDLYPIKII